MDLTIQERSIALLNPYCSPDKQLADFRAEKAKKLAKKIIYISDCHYSKFRNFPRPRWLSW